jgi:hypothetical protein
VVRPEKVFFLNPIRPENKRLYSEEIRKLSERTTPSTEAVDTPLGKEGSS